MRRVSGAFCFVWTTWGLLCAAALLFVSKFGSSIPYWDDWNMIAVVTGNESVNAHWLWSEHNGHRIPVPRLLLLGLYRLSGSDARAGMYFNVILLATAALILIRAARSQRGRTSYADALFPFVLLNWGHYENLLWCWQVTQVLPVCIACALLALLVENGGYPKFITALFAGICLVVLPLCGVPGLVYVPALSVWLFIVGLHLWRSAGFPKRYQAPAIWSLVLAALSVTALYFVNYQQSAPHLAVFHPRSSVIAGLQFLTGSFGPAGQFFWPLSGIVMLGLLLLTLGVLIASIRGSFAREPSPALGLLFFMFAVACLAASVGLGRRGAAFSGRYFLLAVPSLCVIYYSWGICLRPSVCDVSQMALCGLVGLSLPLNFGTGLSYGTNSHQRLEAFKTDLLAGKPTSELLARHASSLCPCPFGGEPTWGIATQNACVGPKFWARNCIAFHDWLGTCLSELNRAGSGCFRFLQPENTVFREVAVSGATPMSNNDAPTGPTSPAGKVSDLTLPGQEPIFVCGIRIIQRGNANATTEALPRRMQVFWKQRGQHEFVTCQRYIHYWWPGEISETIWLYCTIDRLVADVDNQVDGPDAFQFTLLLPLHQ